MYTNYIFDLYGTLVDIHTNKKSKILWSKLSLFYSFNGAIYSSDELKASYLNKFKKKQKSLSHTKYPDFPLENIFKILYEEKEVKPSEELVKSTAHLFRTLSIKYLKLYNGVIELLELLKRKEKNIYLLSNAQQVFTLYEMRILDIEKYFDKIYFSSDYYICKPDSKFFEQLISDLNLDIKKSIMIGNDPICDIKGAQSVGLDTLYIHSNLSPEIKHEFNPTYKVMNGDVNQISSLIIN